MSTSNGQNANATTFNNAYVSKTADSTTVGKLTVNKPADGASVDVQVDINALKATTVDHETRIDAIEAIDQGTQAELDAHAADTSTHGVGEVAGLTETQTLTNKKAGDGLKFTEIASPSAQAASTRILYPKSDGKFYHMGSDGVETAVGSGSGGSGINHLSANPDAESGTTGYATYADAAATSPVDGNSGSPTVTWTRSTSSPLRSTGSFLLTKDAANRQGEGASYDFTIGRADRYSVHTIKFNYEIASGTYADNDISIWIYDVTNATLIQPVGYQLKNATINSTHQSTFQTSDSASYRLIIHVASTSASAYTVKFDDMIVGPQSIARGPMISDWVSYTPTFTGFGTAASIECYWRRIGDSVELLSKFTSGTSTGVEARMTLPSGLTSSSTDKIPTIKIVGDFNRDASGAELGRILAEPSVSYVTFGLQYVSGNGLAKQNGSTFVSSGQKISLHATVPILGWSSNQVLSSEEDGRVCSLVLTSTANVTTAVNTIVNFPVVSKDTHGGWNTSTGVYTVKIPGDYVWSFGGGVSGTAAASGIQAYKNGVATGIKISVLNTSVAGASHLLENLKAGDTIDFRADSTNGFLYSASVYKPYLSFYRLSGPAQIAASETVSASYWLSANWTLAATTAIPFDSKDYDSHGAFTTGAGAKFTAPISGEYEVGGYFKNNVSLVSAVSLVIYKNGAQARTLGIWDNTNIDIVPDTKIKLLAGDYIDFRISAAPGGGAMIGGAAITTTGVSYVQITRTGNY